MVCNLFIWYRTISYGVWFIYLICNHILWDVIYIICNHDLWGVIICNHVLWGVIYLICNHVLWGVIYLFIYLFVYLFIMYITSLTKAYMNSYFPKQTLKPGKHQNTHFVVTWRTSLMRNLRKVHVMFHLCVPFPWLPNYRNMTIFQIIPKGLQL